MTLIVPILVILALVQLVIGVGILFQSRRSKQIHQRVFVVLLACLLVWTISSTILSYVDSYASLSNIHLFNAINRLSYATGACTIALIYLFSLYYPVKKKNNGYRIAVLIAGLLLALVAPVTLISGSFFFVDNKLAYSYGLLSSLFIVYSLVVLVLLILDAVVLYRSAADRNLKRQAVTMLAGLILTVVHAVVFIIILPGIFKNAPILYGIGYLAPYYYTSFTAYSLVRQGLFDVRAVVVRSVAYAASLTLLALASGGVVFLVSYLFLGGDIGFKQATLFSAVSAGVALIYQPLMPRFNRWTNKLFYREAYSPQNFIDELNKLLVSTIQLDEMLQKSGNLIASTLRTDLCSFVLYDHKKQVMTTGTTVRSMGAREKQLLEERSHSGSDRFILVEELEHGYNHLKSALEKEGVNLVLPMIDAKHGAEVAGYIMLGEKKSGSAYNAQDVRVLTIVANELVIAIQNALRFEEIGKFNETLQEKIDDATRQLRRTNDKLRKLDETKDDFISMASHQLRTPLTSVKGYVSMVLDGDAGKITPLQRKLLTQSFISSQRMVYLISDLLNVSRLKTGKFIIEPVTTNLSTVIEEEVDQLIETAKSRNLELSFNKPEHFPSLLLDETKIRQVIMNFIDNAVYYTPSGGHIVVNLIEKPKTIEFSVTDDGIGVSRHEQHHLFSKFFRANNAKRARPDGTGLGLFMAKKVIVAQGGAIMFKSQEGRGSTFGFTFAKDRLTPDEQKPTYTA